VYLSHYFDILGWSFPIYNYYAGTAAARLIYTVPPLDWTQYSTIIICMLKGICAFGLGSRLAVRPSTRNAKGAIRHTQRHQASGISRSLSLIVILHWSGQWHHYLSTGHWDTTSEKRSSPAWKFWLYCKRRVAAPAKHFENTVSSTCKHNVRYCYWYCTSYQGSYRQITSKTNVVQQLTSLDRPDNVDARLTYGVVYLVDRRRNESSIQKFKKNLMLSLASRSRPAARELVSATKVLW
jgi:hypothetical protein